MADHRKPPIATGDRGELRIDASRCMRMRYSESSCRRCAAVCPHDAVELGDALAIKPDRCTGCLLCTAECPVGALEQVGDFYGCLGQLSRVPEPVLGCIRSKESSHATMACLGGLSEEHLATLCHSLSGKLTLNQTACSDCPNSTMAAHLKARLDGLAEAGLIDCSCRIVMAESAQDLKYRDESVDRRSFFRAFRTSLFKSTAVLLSTTVEPVDRRVEYAGKRLPIRRELLQWTRNSIPRELEGRVGEHFDCGITFADSCTGCQACAAICPTGALKPGPSDTAPAFDHLLCTGCGLCGEFCLDGALQISCTQGHLRRLE